MFILFFILVRAIMWSQQQTLLNDYYRSQAAPPSHLYSSPFTNHPTTAFPSSYPSHTEDINLLTPPKSEHPPPPLTELTPPESEHGEDKPFACGYPKCSYLTNRRNNLKRHVVTMHERLASPHICCNITFFRKADMRIHNKEFHKNGYVCTWQSCNKPFLRKALLDRHMKTHTGEKPFICSICNYGTSHKSNLDRHVKIHAKPASPAKMEEFDIYRSNVNAPTWNGYKMVHVESNNWPVSMQPRSPEVETHELPDSTTELHHYENPRASCIVSARQHHYEQRSMSPTRLHHYENRPVSPRQHHYEQRSMSPIRLHHYENQRSMSPPRHNYYEQQPQRPMSPQRFHSLLNSPEKHLQSISGLLQPFPDLNSFTSILLSPLKTERREAGELEDLLLRDGDLNYTHHGLTRGEKVVTHTISNILGI